jgi:hypothetical protein
MTRSTLSRLVASLVIASTVLGASTAAFAGPRKSGDITCTFYGNCKPTPCPRGKKADGTCW